MNQNTLEVTLFEGETNAVTAQVEFVDPPKDAKIGERVCACAHALAYLFRQLLPSTPSDPNGVSNTQIFVAEVAGALPDPFTPAAVNERMSSCRPSCMPAPDGHPTVK